VIVFREAARADQEGIAALRARCFPDEEIEKHFPISRTFIAEADGVRSRTWASSNRISSSAAHRTTEPWRSMP
jgi:hypothetical protein